MKPAEELLPQVYDELRKLAAAKLDTAPIKRFAEACRRPLSLARVGPIDRGSRSQTHKGIGDRHVQALSPVTTALCNL